MGFHVSTISRPLDPSSGVRISVRSFPTSLETIPYFPHPIPTNRNNLFRDRLSVSSDLKRLSVPVRGDGEKSRRPSVLKDGPSRSSEEELRGGWR